MCLGAATRGDSMQRDKTWMPERGEGLICCEEKCRGGLGCARHCFLFPSEATLGLLPAGPPLADLRLVARRLKELAKRRPKPRLVDGYP